MVRAKRKSLGLSQEKLAEQAGCDRQSINRVENAAYSPSLDRVFKLADALGMSLSDLFDEFDRVDANGPTRTAPAGGTLRVRPAARWGTAQRPAEPVTTLVRRRASDPPPVRVSAPDRVAAPAAQDASARSASAVRAAS